MSALVTIGNFDFPEPSEYSANTATLVDSARNVNGRVVGAVVRHDVAKVELKWRYLTAEQWADILGLFTSKFYNKVTFYNQSTADYTTREMYCGDRSASMWRRHPETGEIMGWIDCKLALIEV